MSRSSRRRLLSAIFLAGFCLSVAFPATAGTKVRITTPIGNIDLELYDEDKPVTVANFLKYVTLGRYSGTYIHRLAFENTGEGFVVQGGGYSLNAGNAPVAVAKFDPIVNEYAVGPLRSNTFGTIAMAKLPATDDFGDPIAGGGPDSATSEWFINLGNNAANLDYQNGGFTVFGHVIAGFEILQRFNTTFNDANPATDAVVSELPVLKYNGAVFAKDLLYTTVSVLTDPPPAAPPLPTITFKGAAPVKVGRSSAKIAGKGSSSVVKVEWRLGAKGKFRQRAAGISWNLRVSGLKMGTNVVAVRGISATGDRGALKKLRIVRQ